MLIHVSLDLCSTPKLMSLKCIFVNNILIFPCLKSFLWLHSSEGGTQTLTRLQVSCFTSILFSILSIKLNTYFMSCLSKPLGHFLITPLKSLRLHIPRTTAVGRSCFYDVSRRATGQNIVLEIQVQIQFTHGDIRE